jgi:hypothetical protein
MHVQNMMGHSNRPVANQFRIQDDAGNVFFQSYQTVIAKIDPSGAVTLDARSWDCSNTTGKYRNLFLGESKKETEKKIKSGEYKLVNLN